MAFTDQILNSILEDKQRLLQKSGDLIRNNIIRQIPLVQTVGESTLKSPSLSPETIQTSLSSDLIQLCPTPQQSQNIVNIKRSVEEKLLQVLKKTNNAREISRSLLNIITGIATTITILKTLPIPNSFTTAGLILTLGDLLDVIKVLLDRFQAQVKGLEYVSNSTDAVVFEISQDLQVLDNILAICNYSELLNLEGRNEQLQELLKDINTNAYDTITQESYKNYLIKIENDDKSPPIAPRRYAIIISPLGATVYKGPPSFSSSTQVLIDEAKFYIDRLEN